MSGDKKIVMVGKKPTMNYVLAVVMDFNHGSEYVLVQARGQNISKAVDVAELVKEFVDGIDVSAGIGTDRFTGRDGKSLATSSITVCLRRGD